MRIILALALLLVSPAMAFAHEGAGSAAGVLHGFEHPFGGLDHVLAMVAVGVFATVLGGKALWLVPASFVGLMVAGFALGLAQTGLPFVELGIGLSSVVIGAAAAWGTRMPLAAAVGLVGVFAVFHGHAHGAEMAQDAGTLTYALGFVAATTLLHIAGIVMTAGVSRLAGRHGQTVARIAGGVFAVGGMSILAGWA